jgi:two-component system cell cycle sensor histidine kinase/response regulator CckA
VLAQSSFAEQFTPRSLHVLIVEDSDADAVLTQRALRNGGFDPVSTRVETAEEMRVQLADRQWDLIVSDHSLARFSAERALALLHGKGLDIPFIVVSGPVGEESAVATMRLGAHDFILKEHWERLASAVDRELRERLKRQATRDAEASLRATEERLRRAHRMEAVERLASGVAHDLNNVLSVIMSYADLVLSDLKREDPIRPDIEEILMAAKRAARLTSQLLSFSRQQVVQPSGLDFNRSVAGMTGRLERVVGGDVQLTLLPAPSPGRVRVGARQIEEVVLNLAANARDAMPEGGKLTIVTRNVDIDRSNLPEHPDAVPGPYVMLEVSDTGLGIDDETLTKIFEPFFTTKGGGGGRGLGLSTVFGIVSQCGGQISVQSEVGRGTRFKMYFPRMGGAFDRPVAGEGRGVQRHGHGADTLRLNFDASLARLSRLLRADAPAEEEGAMGRDRRS